MEGEVEKYSQEMDDNDWHKDLRSISVAHHLRGEVMYVEKRLGISWEFIGRYLKNRFNF